MGLYTPEQQARIDAAMKNWGSGGVALNNSNTPMPSSVGTQPPAAPPTIPPTQQGMPRAYSNASNAINMPNMPAQGYGGAVYGNSDWATKQSIHDNESKLSDPNFVKSEYTRATGVRDALKSGGSDYTDQQNYLNRLQGMMPQAATVNPTAAPTTVNMPQSSGDAVTSVRSSSDLQQQSGDKLAIERAALKTAIEAKIGSLKNNAEYQNKLLGDQRVLENANFQRNNNPFSGQTDYAAATLGRGRQIDDTQRFGELNNQLNSTQQELTNFDTLAPERQRQIYNEMLNLERNFGLQQGSLTGNYAGSRTMAAQGQDAQYTGMYGGQQTMQSQAQQFNQGMAQKDANWNAYKDAVGMTGNLGSGPKSDWGQLPGQTGQASYPAQQQDIQNTAQYTGYYKNMPTMQKIMQDNSIKNMNSDNARAAASEARSAGNQSLATKLNIWDRTGEAPEGIPGVTAGTKLAGKTASAKPPTSTDYKMDPNFGEDVTYFKANPKDVALLDSNAGDFIKEYGYDGYVALRKAAGLE